MEMNLGLKCCPKCERRSLEYDPCYKSWICKYIDCNYSEKMKRERNKRIEFKFIWYDFWIGFYYDKEKRTLYFCPFPCFCFKIKLKKKDKYE